MDNTNKPSSINIEFDCLGDRAGTKDPNFDAVQRCYYEVQQFQQVAPKNAWPDTLGVSNMREGILANLKDGNISTVERFLNHPSLDNFPEAPELPDGAQASMDRKVLFPKLDDAVQGAEKGVQNFMTRLAGYDPSAAHKVELMERAEDFLRSPAGNDLVISYQKKFGPT